MKIIYLITKGTACHAQFFGYQEFVSKITLIWKWVYIKSRYIIVKSLVKIRCSTVYTTNHRQRLLTVYAIYGLWWWKISFSWGMIKGIKSKDVFDKSAPMCLNRKWNMTDWEDGKIIYSRSRFLWTFAFYELFFNPLWVFIYVNYVSFYELRVLWTFFAGTLRVHKNRLLL